MLAWKVAIARSPSLSRYEGPENVLIPSQTTISRPLHERSDRWTPIREHPAALPTSPDNPALHVKRAQGSDGVPGRDEQEICRVWVGDVIERKISRPVPDEHLFPLSRLTSPRLGLLLCAASASAWRISNLIPVLLKRVSPRRIISHFAISNF